MDFYEQQLVLLGVFCCLGLAIDRTWDFKREDNSNAKSPSAASLARRYLVVYGIVMGADWLQGPYIYSLYREQYSFPERMVAILFVTGFLSAALAAPLVGVWADQHGRRRLCLAFCLTYTLACLCVAIPSLPILIFGRFLGGISTSILFSAFESWLISAALSSGVTSSELSSIMGRATLVNGLVASAAGVVSNKLVSTTQNFVSPFAASGLLLLLAWAVIRGTWVENYGGGGGQANTDPFQVKRLGEAWKIVRKDPLLLVLGLTQTCFEGSMYLFVFIWVPSLQEQPDSTSELPLGLIFSSFMICMMLGSLVYTAITNRSKSESSLSIHAKLSSLVCAFSAVALASSVAYTHERQRFWAFCLFEACVGMYYPVQGMLRSTLISNEHRATVSSLFRIPLNVFVVVSLLTGVSSARTAVMTASAVVLSISSVMTCLIIVKRADEIASPDHGR